MDKTESKNSSYRVSPHFLSFILKERELLEKNPLILPSEGGFPFERYQSSKFLLTRSSELHS